MNGGCRGTIRPARIKQRSTHTIRLGRGRHWIASNPRQGPASFTHPITAIPLPPDHGLREQTIHHTETATPAAGALVAAIGIRERPQCLHGVPMPGHLGLAARRNSLLRRHTTTPSLRQLRRIPRTAGSPLRDPRLADEQHDEQPAEHAYIVRRAGALDKRDSGAEAIE